MKAKKYIVYLLILALLGAYYAYFEVYRKDKREEETQKEKKVFEVNVDKVDKVTLTRKNDGEIVLTREDKDNWSIDKPLKLHADRMEVEELLGNLNKLERQMSISKKTDDLKQYGLAEPSLTVRFATGDKQNEISFGDKNPVSNDYYAMIKDQPEVFVVASPTYNVINKDLFTLRDKSVFSAQSSEADGVEIAKGDFKAVLAKDPEQESKWKLQGSDDFRVNADPVKDITRQFAWLRATAFDQETDDNLEKFGLDKPRAALTLRKGDSEETLLIGAQTKDGKAYARKVGKPGVFSIEERYTNLIPGDLKSIEDRTVLAFNVDDVKKVSWNNGDKQYELSKQDDKWTWDKPEEAKSSKSPESWSVETALWQLKGLEYTESDGLAKPGDTEKQWGVAVSKANGEPLAELTVFASGDKPEDEVLIDAKTKEQDRVYRVHRKSLQDVKRKLEELVEKKS